MHAYAVFSICSRLKHCSLNIRKRHSRKKSSLRHEKCADPSLHWTPNRRRPIGKGPEENEVESDGSGVRGIPVSIRLRRLPTKQETRDQIRDQRLRNLKGLLEKRWIFSPKTCLYYITEGRSWCCISIFAQRWTEAHRVCIITDFDWSVFTLITCNACLSIDDIN